MGESKIRHFGENARIPFINVLWVLSLLIMVGLLVAQEGKWLTGEARVVVSNITVEEARRKAVELARLNALEKMQVFIQAQQHLLRSDSPDEKLDAFVESIRSTVKARIVAEDTLQWEQSFTADGLPVYRVKLRIKAVPEKGEPDPGFLLNLQLNRHIFRPGDEMVIQVQPTRDCYLYLFNLVSGDSLFLIFPNDLFRDNFIQAGERFIFPPPEYQRHLALEVKSSGQRTTSRELLLAIATTRKIPFQDIRRDTLSSLAYFPRLRSALLALNRWLLNFNLHERTEESIVYQVIPQE